MPNMDELYPNTRWDKKKPEHPKQTEDRLRREAEQKRVDNIYASSQKKLDEAKAAVDAANTARVAAAKAFSDKQKAETQAKLDALYAGTAAQEAILDGRKPALKSWDEVATQTADPNAAPAPAAKPAAKPKDSVDLRIEERERKEMLRLRLEDVNREREALHEQLGTASVEDVAKDFQAAEKRESERLGTKWGSAAFDDKGKGSRHA